MYIRVGLSYYSTWRGNRRAPHRCGKVLKYPKNTKDVYTDRGYYMYNTDNKHFITTIVCDTIKKGITGTKEIIKHITGTYIINGKEIVKDEQSDTDSKRDD